jgi:hypothetical protein
MSNLNIYINYPGIGDSLFYSHIPRLAKLSGRARVCIYLPSEVFYSDKAELIWKLNPYVDEIKINTLDLKNAHTNSILKMPFLDAIAHDFGLPYENCFYEPEVYYTPQKSYADLDIYDGNYVTGAGIIDENLLSEFILNSTVDVKSLKRLSNRYHKYRFTNEEIITNNLSDYFDVVATCRNFFCVISGGASLRPAFGKSATAFFGVGQNVNHRHSKLNNYVNVSPRYTNISPTTFGFIYRALNKINREK